MRPEIHQLQRILNSKKELTAKELAKLMGCSIPAVYRRINALVEHGAVLSRVKVPGEQTGPVPSKYTLVRMANS